jgi:hypothetical protein
MEVKNVIFCLDRAEEELVPNLLKLYHGHVDVVGFGLNRIHKHSDTVITVSEELYA